MDGAISQAFFSATDQEMNRLLCVAVWKTEKLAPASRPDKIHNCTTIMRLAADAL